MPTLGPAQSHHIRHTAVCHHHTGAGTRGRLPQLGRSVRFSRWFRYVLWLCFFVWIPTRFLRCLHVWIRIFYFPRTVLWFAFVVELLCDFRIVFMFRFEWLISNSTLCCLTIWFASNSASTTSYGEGEINWSKGYAYIALLQNFSQLAALYCLVWFYVATGKDLQPFGPGAKFIAVKAVVFMTFWQSVHIPLCDDSFSSCLGPQHISFFVFRLLFHNVFVSTKIRSDRFSMLCLSISLVHTHTSSTGRSGDGRPLGLDWSHRGLWARRSPGVSLCRYIVYFQWYVIAVLGIGFRFIVVRIDCCFLLLCPRHFYF